MLHVTQEMECEKLCCQRVTYTFIFVLAKQLNIKNYYRINYIKIWKNNILYNHLNYTNNLNFNVTEFSSSDICKNDLIKINCFANLLLNLF